MGPLKGKKIIEIAAVGPCPFAGMILSDLGAEVIRIVRPDSGRLSLANSEDRDFFNRGKKSLILDLKRDDAQQVLFRLIKDADALIEGFRPGVMEKLGVGPADCFRHNSRLVYGRMTGWGQEGPLAHAAGHDLNYIALTGALHAIGLADGKPVVPLNIIGDFGGGGMLLALGVVTAMLEAQNSRKGQIVDAAMVDGVSLLMTMMYGAYQSGLWENKRGANVLDGGAPFYNVYETSDGKYISIAAIEPTFYSTLINKLGLDCTMFPDREDRESWGLIENEFVRIFKSRSRHEWCELLEGTDVCFAPVLDVDEVTTHPQMKARETFFHSGEVWQPAPAPRFSRSRVRSPETARRAGDDTDEVLMSVGYTKDEIGEMRDKRIIS